MDRLSNLQSLEFGALRVILSRFSRSCWEKQAGETLFEKAGVFKECSNVKG